MKMQKFVKDSKGNIESDSSLKDTESISLKDDVYEYFKKESKASCIMMRYIR